MLQLLEEWIFICFIIELYWISQLKLLNIDKTKRLTCGEKFCAYNIKALSGDSKKRIYFVLKFVDISLYVNTRFFFLTRFCRRYSDEVNVFCQAINLTKISNLSSYSVRVKHLVLLRHPISSCRLFCIHFMCRFINIRR